MYFGYASLARFPFIAAGFWIVMATALGFGLVYVVGARGGKRAAKRWTDAWTGILFVALTADIVWAVASGQWAAFMLAFGWSPLIEMGMLGALFVGSMWFMAIRYTQGLEK